LEVFLPVIHIDVRIPEESLPIRLALGSHAAGLCETASCEEVVYRRIDFPESPKGKNGYTTQRFQALLYRAFGVASRIVELYIQFMGIITIFSFVIKFYLFYGCQPVWQKVMRVETEDIFDIKNRRRRKNIILASQYIVCEVWTDVLLRIPKSLPFGAVDSPGKNVFRFLRPT
jgi:hypothetical protein